jgi:hypothetical protein
MEGCLVVFESLIREGLPCLAIDAEPASYAGTDISVKLEARRRFLQDHFRSRMMGPCFFLAEQGRTGLRTGSMASGYKVMVLLRCSTPVIFRPEGNHGKYRLVGDIYIDSYIQREAIGKVDDDKRQLKRYVIH